jgi:hypothetical protein
MHLSPHASGKERHFPRGDLTDLDVFLSFGLPRSRPVAPGRLFV